MTDLTNRSELTDDQALAAFLALDVDDDGVSLESLFAQAKAVSAKYGDDDFEEGNVEVSDETAEEIALAVDAANSYDGYELTELFELVDAIGSKYDYVEHQE